MARLCAPHRLHYMKKTIQAEDATLSYYAFLDDTDFAEIAVRERNSPGPVSAPTKTRFIDSLVTALKWVFLYLPGATTIHLIMIGMALFFFHDVRGFEMVAGTIGAALVAVFMVMLGIGKLTDLRYLKVAGGIFAVGGLASVVYAILATMIPGDFVGFYIRLTLPLTLLSGYLVKWHTDRQVDAEQNGLDPH